MISTLIMVILVISFTFGYNYFLSRKSKVVIKIFSAGSLSIPLERIKEAYQSLYRNIEIEIESSGSVLAIRKVTELGKKADIIAVADYVLIPKMMIPKWTDWYVIFATNKIVLAFTNKSKYAREINANNWCRILLKNDVRFGFSNPNLDPCGYRSLMVIAMATSYYNDSTLEKIILDSSNIKIRRDNFYVDIFVPADFKVFTSEKIIVRDKSVSLISLLEAGVLDYAFEYQSVAKQHGLKYISLPDAINLASLKHAENYKKYKVYLYYNSEKEQIVQGQLITYSLTVPRYVNRSEVFNFLRFMLSSDGLNILYSLGQEPIDPPLGFGNIPKELSDIVAKN